MRILTHALFFDEFLTKRYELYVFIDKINDKSYSIA